MRRLKRGTTLLQCSRNCFRSRRLADYTQFSEKNRDRLGVAGLRLQPCRPREQRGAGYASKMQATRLRLLNQYCASSWFFVFQSCMVSEISDPCRLPWLNLALAVPSWAIAPKLNAAKASATADATFASTEIFIRMPRSQHLCLIRRACVARKLSVLSSRRQN